jgi:hypothetical protein
MFIPENISVEAGNDQCGNNDAIAVSSLYIEIHPRVLLDGNLAPEI